MTPLAEQFDPFHFVEPCEPDCTPERHAYHKGQWDLAAEIEKSFPAYEAAIRADERAKVNDEWMNQKANEHDARIRADQDRVTREGERRKWVQYLRSYHRSAYDDLYDPDQEKNPLAGMSVDEIAHLSANTEK